MQDAVTLGRSSPLTTDDCHDPEKTPPNRGRAWPPAERGIWLTTALDANKAALGDLAQ